MTPLKVAAHIVTKGTDAMEIKGRVTDAETGEPLIGCTVQVKGSGEGTATDANGSYQLKAPDGQAVLVFNYVGYKETEIPVNDRIEIDVTLSPAVSELSQVVVIGYGSATKRDVTGDGIFDCTIFMGEVNQYMITQGMGYRFNAVDGF